MVHIPMFFLYYTVTVNFLERNQCTDGRFNTIKLNVCLGTPCCLHFHIHTKNHLLEFYSVIILKVRGGLEFSLKETSGQFQESL